MALDLNVCDTGEESLFNNACVTCSRSTDSLWNHLCSDVDSLLSIQLSIDSQSVNAAQLLSLCINTEC